MFFRILSGKRLFFIGLIIIAIIFLANFYFTPGNHVISRKAPPVLIGPVGGLGNQLFQYAAAYALAKKRNSPLYGCVSSNWNKSMDSEHEFNAWDRSYLLWAFNVSYDIIIELKEFDCVKTAKGFEEEGTEIFTASESLIYENKVPVDQMVYLSGYYESEIFFESYRKEIGQLSLQTMITEGLESTIDNFTSAISTTESVAVHVRRGDFSSENRVLPISYYTEAIEKMKLEMCIQDDRKNLTFFVFSDDIDKVRIDFQNITENFVFVSNKNFSRLTDFLLMSLCKHLIIANSTFSWWAAYLNRNKKKIVIAPLPKFPPECDFTHVNDISVKIYDGEFAFPHNWITINPFKS